MHCIGVGPNVQATAAGAPGDAGSTSPAWHGPFIARHTRRISGSEVSDDRHSIRTFSAGSLVTAPRKAIRPLRTYDACSNYVALGIVTTAAPRAALLDALDDLRGQVDVRLPGITEASEGRSGRSRYRVEVALPEGTDPRYAIEIWRRVKRALLAGFPAGRAESIQIIET
jgi:hypothetical protein